MKKVLSNENKYVSLSKQNENKMKMETIKMTSSELKANEIYNKHADLYKDDFPNWEEKAKEHALITIGEILNSTPFKLGFWMDVKIITQNYKP